MGRYGRGAGGRGFRRGRGGHSGGTGHCAAQDAASIPDVPSVPEQLNTLGKKEELALLQQQELRLEQQLESVRGRLSGFPATAYRRIAIVDPVRCTACGICTSSCPHEAIHVETSAEVNCPECRGCGACVIACPSDAIRLEIIAS